MGEGRKDNIGTATKQERTGQKGGKEGLREREREREGGGGGGVFRPLSRHSSGHPI